MKIYLYDNMGGQGSNWVNVGSEFCIVSIYFSESRLISYISRLRGVGSKIYLTYIWRDGGSTEGLKMISTYMNSPLWSSNLHRVPLEVVTLVIINHLFRCVRQKSLHQVYSFLISVWRSRQIFNMILKELLAL